MSSTRTRRSTSAAIPYSESDAAAIRTSLNELRVLITREEVAQGQEPLQDCSRLLQTIGDSLSQSGRPNKFQDAFRNLNGFQRIIEVVHFASLLAQRSKGDTDGVKSSYELVEASLKLLTAALQSHRGNRRYFRHRTEVGGWQALRYELKEYFPCISAAEIDPSLPAKLFGQLLACSLEDDKLGDLFTKLDTKQDKQVQPASDDAVSESWPEEVVKSAVGTQNFVFHPEALPVLLDLWYKYQSSQQSSVGALPSLPTVLLVIVSSRTHNLIAANGVDLLSEILGLLKSPSLPPRPLSELQKLSIALLGTGISKLDDAYLLYANATSSSVIASTLRQSLKASDGYPFIHFDLSLHGFSSLELPDLGRTFPPPASQSPGYTISLWFQIVEFDAKSHTTIFGAFDSTQTCFVLVYLEKDTRHLILQTSVTSSRPSVRFKSFEFETAKWYHVCIVHRRPGMTNSSRASLFVDGEFVEQVKAHFPSAPPATASVQESADAASPGRRQGAVQCFLGTPQDLAPRTGRGIATSQWRLGSACLLNDALSDDLIAVHRELGPRYYGNFQDCLGSFQTYEASASLNLRNETLHPGKEEKSIIVAAIRSKAGNLLPESKFLLSVSPATVLDDLDRTAFEQSLTLGGLSKAATKNLRHWAKAGRPSVVVNGAIPSVNRALLNASGTCFLTGQPAVLVPQALDEATWRIGGSAPVCLAILEAADSDDEILRALDILFATVRGSWRNSEAMERENGFGILASLLSSKLSRVNETRALRVPSTSQEVLDEDALMLDVLTKILRFVGYEPDCPENSVINNPLAYRILLVDLDVWRSASLDVQRLYYQQFTVFSIGSKHHMFNARRLARMRELKHCYS